MTDLLFERFAFNETSYYIIVFLHNNAAAAEWIQTSQTGGQLPYLPIKLQRLKQIF